MSNKEFGTLVNDCSEQVLNTALRILGDPEKAQDVHQEVFLAIWKRWHKFNGRTNWSAYLYRVTVRKAIEFAKQSKSHQSLPQQIGRIAGGQKADGPLRTAELQAELAQHLARLPKRQADVFVLSRVEGLDAGQIADVLDCSPNTVRVHLHRAVKRLARELGDYLSE